MAEEKDLLNEDNHTSSELWDERIMDIYFNLDSDQDALLTLLKELAEKLELPNGSLIRDPALPYNYFNIYSDYYDEELIEINIALIQNGFFHHSKLADITLSQLLSIRGISAHNMNLFIQKIETAHMNEYGY